MEKSKELIHLRNYIEGIILQLYAMIIIMQKKEVICLKI